MFNVEVSTWIRHTFACTEHMCNRFNNVAVVVVVVVVVTVAVVYLII